MQLRKIVNLLNNSKSNTIKVSIYLPTLGMQSSEVYTRFKSVLDGYSNPRLGDNLIKIKDVLRERMEVLIPSSYPFKSGLGVMVEVDYSDDTPEITNWITTDLFLETDTYIYVGKVFEIRPLIEQSQLKPEVMVVSLGIDHMRVYQYLDSQIDQLLEVESPFSHKQLGRSNYSSRISTHGNGMIHSGHSDVKQEDQSLVRKLIDYYMDQIKTIETDHNLDPQLILVYGSHNFDSYQDAIRAELTKHYQQVQVEFNNKNIGVPTRELIDAQITELVDAKLEIDLDDAKSDGSLLENKWRDLIRAARRGRINKLVISKDLNRNGYVLKSDFPYPYAVKNSKKVNNLAPWLVSRVLNTGGEVVIASDDSPELAGELRY